MAGMLLMERAPFPLFLRRRYTPTLQAVWTLFLAVPPSLPLTHVPLHSITPSLKCNPKQSSPTPSHSQPCSESSPSARPHLAQLHQQQRRRRHHPSHPPWESISVHPRRSSRCRARSRRRRPPSRGRRGSWPRRWGGTGRRIGRTRRFRDGSCAGNPAR